MGLTDCPCCWDHVCLGEKDFHGIQKKIGLPELKSEIAALVAENERLEKRDAVWLAREELLKSENADFRAALEFYSDRAKYGHLDNECSDICADGGKIAREAIAKTNAALAGVAK